MDGALLGEYSWCARTTVSRSRGPTSTRTAALAREVGIEDDQSGRGQVAGPHGLHGANEFDAI